jgi:hypothetical protein
VPRVTPDLAGVLEALSILRLSLALSRRLWTQVFGVAIVRYRMLTIAFGLVWMSAATKSSGYKNQRTASNGPTDFAVFR